MEAIIKRYEDGKITMEQANFEMELHAKAAKESTQLTNVLTNIVKFGAKARKEYVSYGLITEGEVIAMGIDIENEALRCPAKDDKTITRAACLDYSGDAAHTEDCDGCPNFAITRKRLLGETP
jgi:hypothetical protein